MLFLSITQRRRVNTACRSMIANANCEVSKRNNERVITLKAHIVTLTSFCKLGHYQKHLQNETLERKSQHRGKGWLHRGSISIPSRSLQIARDINVKWQ